MLHDELRHGDLLRDVLDVHLQLQECVQFSDECVGESYVPSFAVHLVVLYLQVDRSDIFERAPCCGHFPEVVLVGRYIFGFGVVTYVAVVYEYLVDILFDEIAEGQGSVVPVAVLLPFFVAFFRFLFGRAVEVHVGASVA